MALTVTTDLTVLTTAEVITNWLAIGAQSPALEPDFYVQGNNCISRAVSGALSKGMVFDNGAGIDFTTGTHKDKLVYIWMRSSTAGLCATRAGGGIVVRLATGSATTNYRDWYVDGSDTLIAVEGFVCYVIDPQSAGSATSGSYSAANVRYFGGYMTTTTTAKGQNFGIDQISYGRGEIYVSGTVATAGQGFKEIADVAYDSARTNRWGIITVKRGIIYVKGKIIIGHPSTDTTFSSRAETVVWETPGYYNGSNVVKTIPDASVGATAGTDGATTYNGLAFRGGATNTNIDIGVIVGTDSGRSGSSFVCAENAILSTPGRTLATIRTDNSTMALSIYATSFIGFEGTVNLAGTGVSGDNCFAVTFNGCGRVDSTMKIRNSFFINSVAAADDGAYIWTSSTDLQKCVFANNSRAIVFESATGSPFSFTSMTFSGNTVDVRNESNASITINVLASTTPSYEDIGGSSSTTLVIDPTTITIVANVTLVGAEVRVYDLDNSPAGSLGTELSGTESSGTATYQFTATPSNLVYVQVMKSGYVEYGQEYTIPSTSQDLNIKLTQDVNS